MKSSNISMKILNKLQNQFLYKNCSKEIQIDSNLGKFENIVYSLYEFWINLNKIKIFTKVILPILINIFNKFIIIYFFRSDQIIYTYLY